MEHNAYHYNLVRINLTDRSITRENIDPEEAKKYLGGRGLGTKWLYDDGVAKVDPLSEENKLVFITGPLTGTNSPCAGRFMVVSKQPLNNRIGSANSGGVWGAKLKYSGIDALIVEGKADKPVRLFIEDDHIEIIEAEELWGTTLRELTGKLEEVHGDKSSTLAIGPAGEHLSKISCIMNDEDRAAGRGGLGAVMGSKNLKAITVIATKGVIEPQDKDAMSKAFKESMAKIKENTVLSTGLPTYGTAILVNIINGVGALPTNNWQQSQFDDAEAISGEALHDEYLVKNYHCHRCPIGCGRVIEHEGAEVGGPEYEPLWAYGSNCGVNDLKAINEANYYCNEYGLDAISAPCTLAAAMELYEKGAITDADLEGLPSLKWGDAEAIVEWTKLMGQGNGELASLMADGSAALTEKYGHPEFSMASKKLELPAYDGRAIQGIGLNYATSNRGGCHVRGYTISPEILGLPGLADRTEIEGKGLLVKTFQDLTAAIDSLGLCLFTSFALGADEYTALYNAATGSDLTPADLLQAGERIYNLERLFNKEAGMEANEDSLPKRLTEEPITNGPSQGMVSRLDEMLGDYYKERGWEEAFPSEERLEELGLN